MLVARGVEDPVIRETHDAIAAHLGEALSPEDAQPAQAIVDESHAVLERPLGTIRPGDEHEPDERARRLADALVAGDATAARAIFQEAVEEGMDPSAFPEAAVTPAMREVGNRWQRSEISVADAPPPGRRRRGIHDPRRSLAAAGTRLPSG